MKIRIASGTLFLYLHIALTAVAAATEEKCVLY